jgi:hypothetical protein
LGDEEKKLVSVIKTISDMKSAESQQYCLGQLRECVTRKVSAEDTNFKNLVLMVNKEKIEGQVIGHLVARRDQLVTKLRENSHPLNLKGVMQRDAARKHEGKYIENLLVVSGLYERETASQVATKLYKDSGVLDQADLDIINSRQSSKDFFDVMKLSEFDKADELDKIKRLDEAAESNPSVAAELGHLKFRNTELTTQVQHLSLEVQAKQQELDQHTQEIADLKALQGKTNSAGAGGFPPRPDQKPTASSIPDSTRTLLDAALAARDLRKGNKPGAGSPQAAQDAGGFPPRPDQKPTASSSIPDSTRTLLDAALAARDLRKGNKPGAGSRQAGRLPSTPPAEEKEGDVDSDCDSGDEGK